MSFFLHHSSGTLKRIDFSKCNLDDSKVDGICIGIRKGINERYLTETVPLFKMNKYL